MLKDDSDFVFVSGKLQINYKEKQPSKNKINGWGGGGQPELVAPRAVEVPRGPTPTPGSRQTEPDRVCSCKDNFIQPPTPETGDTTTVQSSESFSPTQEEEEEAARAAQGC